jgi:biotin transport system substrate-specific component
MIDKNRNNTASKAVSRINVYPFILCALFAALNAVCTFINIPLPITPIPINLATLSVFLAGGLLGPKYGPISQIVYILIGCIGLPVFSNYQGGIGVLAGPTGGFLPGYIIAAFVIGLLLNKVFVTGNGGISDVLKIVFSCIVGMLCYFIPGTIWFMILTNSPLWAALTACFFPFLIGDALKIIIATLLITKLHNMVDLRLLK